MCAVLNSTCQNDNAVAKGAWLGCAAAFPFEADIQMATAWNCQKIQANAPK